MLFSSDLLGVTVRIDVCSLWDAADNKFFFSFESKDCAVIL